MNSVLRYTDNTAVVDPRFGTASTPTRPPAWAAVDGTDPGAVVLYASGDTTGVTDRAAIQSAIDDATEDHPVYNMTNAFFSHGRTTRIVLVGKFWINGAIDLKDGVHLHGVGWLGTTIHLAAGANSSMVTMTAPTYWAGIYDIQFDGHSENQTAGGACLDLLAAGAINPRGDSCTTLHVERVMVAYSYGDGFTVVGVEAKVSELFAFRTGGHGIVLGGSDMWASGLTAGDSKKSGFRILGGQHHIQNCKSYWSGYWTADRTKVASKPLGINEPGWLIEANDNMMTNCDSQDASGVGFFITGEGNHMRNVVSDSSRGGHFYIRGNAARNTIEGHCRSIHADVAPYALKLENWPGATVRNRIDLDFPGISHNGTPLITQGVLSVNSQGADYPQGTQFNEVRIGTPDATHITTYAATIIPDPLMGGIDVTLTGGVTIANTVTDRSVHGTELSIMLTQDGTGGRTVAWGSDYVGMSAADTAATKVNLWRIKRVKGRWVQVGFNAY